MNYYSHHIGDYLVATAHLSLLEHGAYRRLIDVYYSTEKPLPADKKSIYRLVMARSKDEQAAVDSILDEFFSLTDLGYSQARCDQEIGLCNKNRTNGKKGGRPPKNNNPNETQTEPRNNPNETQTEPRNNPNETQTESPHYPLPITQDKQPSSLPQAGDAGEAGGGDDFLPIPEIPTSQGQWMTWFNRTQGTEFDPGSRFHRGNVWQTFTRWCGDGVSTSEVSSGIARALAEAKGPISNLPGYVEKLLLNDQQARASPQRMNHSDASKLAAARAIFGTEIEGENHGQSARIIDASPVARLVGG